MKAAIEDIRPAVSDDSFASVVRRSNDDLDLEPNSLLYARSSEYSIMDHKFQ